MVGLTDPAVADSLSASMVNMARDWRDPSAVEGVRFDVW